MVVNGVRVNESSGAARAAAPPASLRQALYRLLAGLFLYPDPERVATLRAVADELLASPPEWTAMPYGSQVTRLLQVLAALPEDDTEPLEVEYNRLFAVRPAAPPYASVYLDPARQAVGMITLTLERAYAEAGLQVAPDLREPPDHAAIEMEYLAYLCSVQAEAAAQADRQAAVRATFRQRQFLERHISRWFIAFADRVAAAQPAPLYEQTIRTARAFVRHELQQLAAAPPV